MSDLLFMAILYLVLRYVFLAVSSILQFQFRTFCYEEHVGMGDECDPTLQSWTSQLVGFRAQHPGTRGGPQPTTLHPFSLRALPCLSQLAAKPPPPPPYILPPGPSAGAWHRVATGGEEMEELGTKFRRSKLKPDQKLSEQVRHADQQDGYGAQLIGL